MDLRRNDDDRRAKTKSGYTASTPWATSTNGVIVEPGDLDEPLYIDGMDELRQQARVTGRQDALRHAKRA